jgi:hypothetical protein
MIMLSGAFEAKVGLFVAKRILMTEKYCFKSITA